MQTRLKEHVDSIDGLCKSHTLKITRDSYFQNILKQIEIKKEGKNKDSTLNKLIVEIN